MAFPPRRVFATAIIPHRRPVEHPFDSSAHSPRSFDLTAPQRFQHLEHEPGIDGADRQVTKNRERVLLQGTDELLAMLGATPLALVGGLIRLRAFGKGDGLRSRHRGFHLLRLAMFDRVDAIEKLETSGTGSLPRF